MFKDLFGKKKEKYVVYQDKDFLNKFSYYKKVDIGYSIVYTNEEFSAKIHKSDIVREDIESPTLAYNVLKLSQCEKDIAELNQKLFSINSKKESEEKINKHLCSVSQTNTPQTLLNIYIVTGEYPNYSIDEKEVVTEDAFNYCVRDLISNNISLYPKDKCFKTYEKANNKILELIQKAVNKESSYTCKCTSKKK